MSSIEINPGDLVSWKTVDGVTHFGIVVNTYIKDLGNKRRFAMARVSSMTGRMMQLLLEHLNLESSV
jgi:hypothetical protein